MPKNITVKEGGASVTMRPYRTPGHELDESVLFVKAYTLIQTMAEELASNEDEQPLIERKLDQSITSLCRFSARVDSIKGADFELLDVSDDTATLREKFTAYLNTAHGQLVSQTLARIDEADTPTDATLAPAPPEERDDPK